MELQLQNERQHKIADLLWEATDEASVNLILKTFGHDAQVVYHMMMATAMDELSTTDVAEKVLNKIFKG